jgi:outer membrane lipoprotein-sorting protein
MVMRPLILAFMLALAAANAAQASSWTAAQSADLDRISAALNSIKTMRGGFTQIGPQGQVDQGKFYILKPGKIRFDYDPPNPTLVISDGIGIAVYNTKLNTANRYPLNGTPLNLLLSDHLNLKRSANVLDVEHSPGELIVKARANDRNATGNITIVFADPGLELRQWTIVDAQGLPTTVSLNNVQQGVDLPESAFKINHK